MGIRLETNNQKDKNEIKKHMEELREELNEICAMEKGSQTLQKRLSLSQELDRLIVEYMSNDKGQL